MIKAVLFDMDGVLADTEPIHFKAAQQVLRKTGKDMPDSALKDFVGISEAAMHKKVKETYGTRHDFLTFERLRRDEFYLLVKDSLFPAKGLNGLLERLDKDNILIGLVTSSGREVVDHILDGLKVKQYFKTIVSADDVSYKKPNAQPYELAIKRLGIKNAEAVAIEDSSHGIEAARNAGIFVIGIKTGYNSDDLAKANKIISSLEEMDIKKMEAEIKVRI